MVGSYKIAVASGKGGVGKTALSLLLFKYLQEVVPEPVSLVDCDVEEPNVSLFLDDSNLVEQIDACQDIPQIDLNKCNFCKKCTEYCEFNAITMVAASKFVEVNKNLCHSCGACEYACSNHAIQFSPEPIGKLSYNRSAIGNFYEGRLKIGSVMQTRLIKLLKEWGPHEGVVVYDAPPGTSCPVVETLDESDFVILVGEPTPFGLHDMKLVIKVLELMNVPFGVVINKCDFGDEIMCNYLHDNSIEILGKIPYDQEFAKSYSEGRILESVPKYIENEVQKIAASIKFKRLYQ
ncbi:ATP-binding protein [Halosquirtibacter laminarini]|uniref:ATP-binding protein n=1 Tax=Halosquirtibacter laminarini TaxID=3374600 RepID=A0AC61NJ08_9BACT|nr:ATP-binding protein [Prolixibacteraceae bacterium]